MSNRYHLTETGLEVNFKQPCGCSAYGAGNNCATGRFLCEEADKDNALLYAGKISLEQADISQTAWIEHLGA